MRVIVARDFGRYARNPGFCESGMAYVLALEALGHEVFVIEEVSPRRLYDRDTLEPVPLERWEPRLDFERVLRAYGVWPRGALIDAHGRTTHGMPFSELAEVAAGADLLLDVSSSIRSPEVFEAVGCRAYVDQAPARSQFKTVEYGYDYYGLQRYEHHFTIGPNIGRPGCEVPTLDLDWTPTVQPVFLPLWPPAIEPSVGHFTTLSSWSGGYVFRVGGEQTGEKSDNWLRFVELPRRTGQPLEITLSVRPGDEDAVELFRSNGWIVSDPSDVTTQPEYQGYIAGSRAEFSVAHTRCVRFATGWFSDRSARYLASGKPALVQSTGIEDHLPVGEGVLTYSTMEEAVDGIEAINADYLCHCRAARVIAEEHFDAVKVLSRMLEDAGLEVRGDRRGDRQSAAALARSL
jgi:hypothetical protein